MTSAVSRLGICLVLALSPVVACGADVGDDPAVGSVDVPLRQPDAIPLGQRGGASVEPVQAVRIAAGPEGRPAFYRAGPMAVGPDGTLFVFDPGAGTIRAFTPDGEPAGTMGSPGQGPGELSELVTALAVAGERLIAVDELNGRLSVWGLDGEFLEVLPFPTEPEGGARISYVSLDGLAAGSLVGLFTRPGAGRMRLEVVLAGADGRPTTEIATLVSDQTRAVVGGRPAPIPVVRPVPQFAVDRRGSVYVTAAERYEIDSYGADGERRWRLRVDWPRRRLPDTEVDRALEASADMLRAMGEAPQVDASSVENVPDRLPALASIKIDGHGHLWVFPYVYWDPRDPGSLPSLMAADVYDAAGERLFAGTIPSRFAVHPDQRPSWTVAFGDSIWGVETDPESGEEEIVRYRLEEPF